jgi:hypothetical protein
MGGDNVSRLVGDEEVLQSKLGVGVLVVVACFWRTSMFYYLLGLVGWTRAFHDKKSYFISCNLFGKTKERK